MLESKRFSWMRSYLVRWQWKAGWMKYSFKPVMYLCVCVAAFLFSYHTHEQPRQSAGPAHSHAPVLLWISSCLWSCWLHPWHAHTGFHGSRGETFFICIVVSALPLIPHLGISSYTMDLLLIPLRKKFWRHKQILPFSRSCQIGMLSLFSLQPWKIS